MKKKVYLSKCLCRKNKIKKKCEDKKKFFIKFFQLAESMQLSKVMSFH